MIQFPTGDIQPFNAPIPALTVKGIGPNSLAATAVVDFTKFHQLTLSNGGIYAGCLLDFSYGGGISNTIDSIRSITIDNTAGTTNVGSVYAITRDTQDAIVCPPGCKATFRLRTNDIKLNVFQQNNFSITGNSGISTVTFVANNYDAPADSIDPEYGFSLLRPVYKGSGSANVFYPPALGDKPFVLATTPADLSSTTPITLIPSQAGSTVITELNVDIYGCINQFSTPSGPLVCGYSIVAGTEILDKRSFLVGTGYDMYPPKTLCERTALQWRIPPLTAVTFTNATVVSGFMNISLTYTTQADI